MQLILQNLHNNVYGKFNAIYYICETIDVQVQVMLDYSNLWSMIYI